MDGATHPDTPATITSSESRESDDMCGQSSVNGDSSSFAMNGWRSDVFAKA